MLFNILSCIVLSLYLTENHAKSKKNVTKLISVRNILYIFPIYFHFCCKMRIIILALNHCKNP